MNYCGLCLAKKQEERILCQSSTTNWSAHLPFFNLVHRNSLLFRNLICSQVTCEERVRIFPNVQYYCVTMVI